MAISAIPPIGNAASLISPLLAPQQIAQQNAFSALTTALQTNASSAVSSVLDAAAISSVAQTGATNDTQSLAQLEQALFNEWLASLQNTDTVSSTPSLDLLLAGQLDATATATTGTLPTLFGSATAQSQNLTTAIISLFDTVQMLGTTVNPALLGGSQLDLLA
ncbi:MAG TPA: hypothetical protein VEV20_02570 [Burkholderiales bacterium]|nr:hypothetical protein [Burkholderiales bacterium]